MSIKSEIEDGLAELRADLLDSTGDLRPEFLWKGATVPCVPNMADAGSELTIGGFEGTLACVLHVITSEFLTVDTTLITSDSEMFTSDNDTPTPVAGRKLTFRGKSYRIVLASMDASQAYFKLVLGTPNR